MRRPRMRFTIPGLMTLIAFLAPAVAALRNPTDLWSDVVFTAAVGVAGVSLLGSVVVRGPGHAAWAGSAVFGGGYLVLAFAPWLSTDVRPHLLTTAALDRLYPRLHGPRLVPRDNLLPYFHVISMTGHDAAESSEHFFHTLGAGLQTNYERVGHSIASMVFALAGALAARRLSRGGPRDEP